MTAVLSAESKEQYVFIQLIEDGLLGGSRDGFWLPFFPSLFDRLTEFVKPHIDQPRLLTADERLMIEPDQVMPGIHDGEQDFQSHREQPLSKIG